MIITYEQTWSSAEEIKDISSLSFSLRFCLDKKRPGSCFRQLLIRTGQRLWMLVWKYLWLVLQGFVHIETHFWKSHSSAVNQAFGISTSIKSHNLIYDLIGLILASITEDITLVCSYFGPLETLSGFQTHHVDFNIFFLTTRYEYEIQQQHTSTHMRTLFQGYLEQFAEIETKCNFKKKHSLKCWWWW